MTLIEARKPKVDVQAPLIGRGVGGHHSARAQTDTWLTPPHIIAALGGPDSFDLDPCGYPGWPTARHSIHLPDDGLAAVWHGRVWLNPPYGQETFIWLDRLAAHAASGGSGTALIFARTETAGFFDHAWQRADAMLFLAGRLTFHNPDGTLGRGNAGAPSVLLTFGQRDTSILTECGLPGALVTGWQVTR